MLRVTSVVFSIISLLLITAIVNGAGNTAPKHEPLIIEISTIRSNGVPTSQPVEGKPQSTV
ncbi:MAG TPA: hypothetical protein VL282_11065 [Tepidisphaeraceae bacterium]|nr:hypothetical protein [Tepidisphaeraceae bacterium]